MKLTPLDLTQHVFKKALQGFESKQVTTFLELVREEWEVILRENQNLKEEVMSLKGRIEEYREKERMLQETLISAQRLTNEMKQTAKKESDIVISQAELQADKIIHQAHGRLTQIIDEINEMKRQRALFEGKLRGLIDSHQRLLNLHNDAPETAQIENISVLSKSS